jgi:hypothetical protein
MAFVDGASSRRTPASTLEADLEVNMLESLDAVPLVAMRK